MSIQLPLLVPLVKTEPLTVIKNEPPEEPLEEEIGTDIKYIDIVYHPLCEDLIKTETVLEDIPENKHLESVQTQAVVKAENSAFIKTENITQTNKLEDTSDGNVSWGTGQGVVEVQASNEHSIVLSKLETNERSVLNFSKNLNGISVRSRNSKSPKKTNFAECYKTDGTTLWEKEKKNIKVIKGAVIPVEAHEYTFLANDRHVCNHCQQTYKKLEYLKIHIRTKHRKVTTMYQCPYCPYKSKWKHNIIKQHIILKHKDVKDIKWFQCNLCEMKCKLKSNLTQHMNIHLKHKQMKDELDLRQKRHARNTDFTRCYKIDRTISREKEKIEVIRAPTIRVKAHEYTSLAKDKHICNHCQKARNNLNNLKLHIKRMHREVTTIYQCPYCTFKSKWSLRLHIIQKHKDTKDIQWFQCHLCEKKFKLKNSLTQHMKVHLRHEQRRDGLDLHEKRYHCDKCNFKTCKRAALKKHKLNHLKPEDIPYFHCYHCSYKSKQKGHLKLHIFRHFKRGKRHHCDECDYKTCRLDALKRHNLIHLKPEETQYFYCYHCSHKNKNKQELKKHIFRHFKNEDVPFHCYICDFITLKRESIITHIKKHSKVQIKFEINDGT